MADLAGHAEAAAVQPPVEDDAAADALAEVGKLAPETMSALDRAQIKAGAALAKIAPQVVVAALEHGFILNAANPSTLRLAPPLIITDEELGSFVEALPALLDAAERAAASTTDEKRS